MKRLDPGLAPASAEQVPAVRHCGRLSRILLPAPSLGSGRTGVPHTCQASLLPHRRFQSSCGQKCPLACLPQLHTALSPKLPDATPWRNAPFLGAPAPLTSQPSPPPSPHLLESWKPVTFSVSLIIQGLLQSKHWALRPSHYPQSLEMRLGSGVRGKG